MNLTTGAQVLGTHNYDKCLFVLDKEWTLHVYLLLVMALKAYCKHSTLWEFQIVLL